MLDNFPPPPRLLLVCRSVTGSATFAGHEPWSLREQIVAFEPILLFLALLQIEGKMGVIRSFSTFIAWTHRFSE
jgi:hypothetical protein